VAARAQMHRLPAPQRRAGEWCPAHGSCSIP
jgi:hypothetical protein